MKINEIKDLELIKNALENYIPNAERTVKILNNSNLPQSIIETTEYNIRRGKELIEELNNEIFGAVKEKVESKIDNGEVIEVMLIDNAHKTES